MNTPSNAREHILNSLCYNSEEWFTREDLSIELGKTGEFISGELRLMNDAKKIVQFPIPGELTMYKKPNPEAQTIAKGSWRTQTNKKIGINPQEIDCWAVI